MTLKYGIAKYSQLDRKFLVKFAKKFSALTISDYTVRLCLCIIGECPNAL